MFSIQVQMTWYMYGSATYIIYLVTVNIVKLNQISEAVGNFFAS